MAKWILWLLLAAPLLVVGDATAEARSKTSPPIPPLLLPETGYWYDAGRSGTGFALQHRDGTLGLVFYHFRDVEDRPQRVADWHLAAGRLQGNTFEAPLAHFHAGNCLGCVPYVPAGSEMTDTSVRLVFASAREATLQLGDGEPRRVVAMAYGMAYEPDLATPADLPLPDLRGRWVIDGDVSGVVTLEERIASAGAVEYRGEADTRSGRPNASFRCDAAQCELWLDALPAGQPEPLFVARFALGDISGDRMTGADAMTFQVQAFRLHDAEGQP